MVFTVVVVVGRCILDWLDFCLAILHLAPRSEVGYPMGKMEKIKETSKRIVKLLKQIPVDVSIKGGAELDLIPKPVVKLFVEIHILSSLLKEKCAKQDADRKEGGKRLHSNDEGVG